MTVVNQPPILTSADLLRQKISSDGQPSQSSGTAWAAITAPGVGSIWDKTAIEARVDPGAGAEQARHLLEQVAAAERAIFAHPAERLQRHPAGHRAGARHRRRTRSRNYQTEQSAKLSIADTGTSLIAGQTLSSTDDKWLRKIGAEQKLFGGVSHQRLDRRNRARHLEQEPHRRASSTAGKPPRRPPRTPPNPGERSSIAAYWPRCGQNRQPRWPWLNFVVRGTTALAQRETGE